MVDVAVVNSYILFEKYRGERPEVDDLKRPNGEFINIGHEEMSGEL